MSDVMPDISVIAQAVRDAGGRAFIVGGSVRDRVLGIPPGGDTDIEIFGLDADAASTVLARFGKVFQVGRAFPVLRLKGMDVDFSLPRQSNVGTAALELGLYLWQGLGNAGCVLGRDFDVVKPLFAELHG